MNVFVVLQQMLVLLTMMALGYLTYRKGWINDESYGHISKICVNILNPCIVIYGVTGKDSNLPGQVVVQNLIFMCIYYVILILLSKPIIRMLKVSKGNRSIYELMLIFSNVGFMGIPVISSIFGQESVVLIAFYMLGYNLVLYTYGLYLSSKTEGAQITFQWKSLLNAGVISCFVALLLFGFQVQLAPSVVNFFDYVGNAVVPMSMMLIGASVAQHADRSFLTDIRMYVFSAIKLLVIPIAAALLMKGFAIDPLVKGVFVMMLAMPVGTIVVMFAKQAGADDMECTKGSVITTLLSIVTIPIVAAFL